MFSVLPSEWYEPFGLSVIESFAMGKPVVGADIGGIPELIGAERGLLFRPGDAADLRRRSAALAADPGAVRGMGRAARRYVEREFSADLYHQRLMAVYAECMGRRAKERSQ
jgi:glycosyltransferase involved in cell wall biosynthesis